ncbi:hypothetical protein QLS91_09770 [Flavobacterium sp. LB2P84]|uniref:Immunity protein 26 of polymorphic toxin system n=2 Tax=Flavobacterium TaxID=237 RepID=A0AAW6TRK5_9FLAO|nr:MULTISPECIES: hypothetical protein [Flavobacterium]MDI5950258.1 hypothetical protein [Flavobacterium yafengii]MDI6033360.1 hypothetical protein [Flavobacterium yafengii]SHM59807.1 Immunity protein 26 [Flavobacterium xanthum]
MKRVIVKKGDIFFVKINDTTKRYFQYITNDLKQLNSDVIRCFKKIYSIEENPNLAEIIKDEVFFYAHCVVKFGVKLSYWEKVGNITNVGTFEHILFRGTNDYGTIEGEEPIKVSNNWYVWHINDVVSEKVGKLEGENRKAEIGIVMDPESIVHRIRTGCYDGFYPDYE